MPEAFPCMFGAVPCIIMVAVPVFIAIMVIGHLQAKKRRESLAAWAARHGLHFTPDKDHQFDARFPEFDCLRHGSDRYAYNIITGEWEGRRIIAFDYHYETESRNSKGQSTTHDHSFSAVVLRAKVPIKPLVIRAETIFDKLGGVFGFDDIDFESAEFSGRYHVKSPDRKWAYDVLHPRTIEFILASPRCNLEFDRRHIIAWSSSTSTAQQHEQSIRLIDGILDRLPAYLIEQQQQIG